MSCEDIPSLLDLQKVKKHADDFGRLMGTGIGTSTNGVTGQVRPTFNKVINEMQGEFNQQISDQESEFNQHISGMAFTRVGTFKSGATLDDLREVLLWDVSDGGDGHEYGWTGTFPKEVLPNSTPSSTGGIGPGAWVDRSDVTLRSELAAAGGASLVGPGVMARGIDKFSIFNGNLGENATPGLRVDLNTLTGRSTGNGNFLNMVFIPSDQLDTTGKVAGQMIDHRFGGGAGGRHGFMSRLIQSSPQLSTTNDQNYVAVVAQVLCDAGDPIETSSGSVLFASESIAESRTDTGKVRAVIGSLHEAGVSGTVIPLDRVGVQVTSQGTGNATRVDAAIGVSSGTSRAAWKNGIKFSNVTGGQVFDSTSCAITLDPESTSQPTMTLDAIIKVESKVTFNNIIDTPRLKLSQSGLDINLSSSYIKLGGVVGSNTPNVSFRSGATAAPSFDSRFIATGGNGSDAGGTLQAQCATLIVSGTLRPSAANTSLCGTTSQPWSGGFTQTAFTVTSDERAKTVPEEITDAMLDAAGEVDWCMFQYLDRVDAKGADGARWHFGAIAQRFVEAFERHGLKPFRYAFICYDEWGDSPELIGEDGEVISPAVDAGSRYGIRYDQAIILKQKQIERDHGRQLDALVARIEALEAK